MNPTRKAIVDQAFRKFDKTGDGYITADDLKYIFIFILGVFIIPNYIQKSKMDKWQNNKCLMNFLLILEMLIEMVN